MKKFDKAIARIVAPFAVILAVGIATVTVTVHGI